MLPRSLGPFSMLRVPTLSETHAIKKIEGPHYQAAKATQPSFTVLSSRNW